MKGFEMGTPNPEVERVKKSFHPDDPMRHEILSAMGKAGGTKSGELSKRRADMRALDEVLRAEHEAKRLAELQARAEETRPGWDDEYRP